MAEMELNNKWLVCVKCFTYNQSHYITDALNGIVMQQTNFPFACCVVDDASTDGEQAVIRDYLCANFDLQDVSVAYEKDMDYGHVSFAQHKTNKNCFFVVIYLMENHRSQKKLKSPYISEWINAKYIALCEGDDYWTDPLKLQKQVGYMEEHQDCCMTACAANWEKDGEIVNNDRLCEESRDLTTEEVILGGGGYLATCSLVYNNDKLNNNIPKWRRMANVGDYPCQIQGTLVGKLHYFPDTMCVYRYCSEGSWTNTYLRNDKELMHIHRQKEVIWMKELDRDTNYMYQKAIYQHLRGYFPMLYRKRMVSTRDYYRSVRIAGGRNDYRSMIKNIVKRILNHHYNDM